MRRRKSTRSFLYRSGPLDSSQLRSVIPAESPFSQLATSGVWNLHIKPIEQFFKVMVALLENPKDATSPSPSGRMIIDEAAVLEASGDDRLESVRQLIMRGVKIRKFDPQCASRLHDLVVRGAPGAIVNRACYTTCCKSPLDGEDSLLLLQDSSQHYLLGTVSSYPCKPKA